MPQPFAPIIKVTQKQVIMIEMTRIRIVPDGSYFHLERLVRKEWIPVLAENSKPLTFTSRELAERYLDELSKKEQQNYRR